MTASRPSAWLPAVATALTIHVVVPTPAAASTEFCLGCHADPGVADGRPSLHVRRDALARSVHDTLECVACHSGYAGAERDFARHRDGAGVADCDPCHSGVASQYRTTVHGLGRLGGSVDAARCADCHGWHDVRRIDDRASPAHRRNLAATCARCHSNPGITETYRIKFPDAANQYMESIHAFGVDRMGLVVAPTCNDCHGVHDIRRDTDPRSPIHRNNIPGTCAKCHVGVKEIYDDSIHGVFAAAGDPRGPICTTCHNVHAISDPTTWKFKLESDERCGSCHMDRLRRYRETYHGKAIDLGRPGVAACFDCHGYHDIRKSDDPRSHTSRENILATCRRCHPEAGEGFTGYQVHADHSDEKQYPIVYWTFVLMTALTLGVFGFFGVHTILWIVRSIYLYVNDSKTFREAKVRTRTSAEMYVRFTPFERFLHLLVIFSFLLLVITGMPLKFHDTVWAHWLFEIIGGADVAAALHRFGAIVTFVYFGLHVFALGRTVWVKRGQMRDPATGRLSFRGMWRIPFNPDSPMPNRQDVRDFVAHQKWFFGRGPKPQFDRWTYWEKFDYLAVFWGVFMIGLSGLVMWFPVFFTGFLPGWIINVALVIHSDEALLAAGFIFTFHFFNAHFRIEKFPMDSVIFSGRISREELEHDRGRWYARLVADGKLDSLRVRDEWEQVKKLAHPIGYIAFGIGVALIILLYWAMSSRLLNG